MFFSKVNILDESHKPETFGASDYTERSVCFKHNLAWAYYNFIAVWLIIKTQNLFGDKPKTTHHPSHPLQRKFWLIAIDEFNKS